MTTYFVTRHAGALKWAKLKKLQFDVHLLHLSNFDQLQANDIIIGTLPINIVYELNRRAVRYVHLSLDIPAELRGAELTAEQLDMCKAQLEEFTVQKQLFSLADA